MPDLRVLETTETLYQVEELQRLVWPGSETTVVPVHMLRAAVDHGGVVIGAYEGELLIGFVFGFPGIEETSSGPRLMHVSHMAGIHPEYRNRGLGFALKRAQWQFVRQQGGERICWTYDPLLSRNANLNIAKLGAVCNTNIPNYYGEMRDGLNAGLPSDRFRVDWWVNTPRVEKRLSQTSRRSRNLAQYRSAEVKLINPVHEWIAAFPAPPAEMVSIPNPEVGLLLVEIPADFQAMRAVNPQLALSWRVHSRQIFQTCFARGYIVTDFAFEPGERPRSFYVLSHGDSTF